MTKQRRAGTRLQSYHVRPVRYTVSAGDVDDEEWGAQLVGIFFLVTGGVLLLAPLIQTLGIGLQILFVIIGAAAFMTGPPNFLVAALMAGILIGVGAGVVKRWGPAFYPAMAVAFFMFMPSFPIGTLVGVVMIYALWQGMPKNKPVRGPEDDSSSAPELS